MVNSILSHLLGRSKSQDAKCESGLCEECQHKTLRLIFAAYDKPAHDPDHITLDEVKRMAHILGLKVRLGFISE
jgi:hypothetical protein